jgi:hypothetical protein
MTPRPYTGWLANVTRDQMRDITSDAPTRAPVRINHWAEFKVDCPITSRIPGFKHWAFGVYMRAYCERLALFAEWEL